VRKKEKMQRGHVLILLAIAPVGAEEDTESRWDRRYSRLVLASARTRSPAATHLQHSTKDKYLLIVFIKLPKKNLGYKTRNSLMGSVMLLNIEHEP
jgi:hypothetical protein